MGKLPVRWPFMVVLFILGLTGLARSSEYGLTFNRDNRTYRWNNFFRYSGPSDQRLQLRAAGSLSKVLIKSASGSSGTDRWQDNLNLSASGDYQLRKWARIGLGLVHEQNSVNKGEIVTRSGVFSSNLTLSPRPNLELKPYVGAKIDDKKQSNLDSREDGLSYGFSGFWRPSIPHTQTSLKVTLAGDKLSAGHSSTRVLLATAKRRLFRVVKISFTVDNEEEGRTNLFGPADATVLKRQDRVNRGLALDVDIPLPRDHQFQLSLSSTDRRIEYSLPEGPDEAVAEQNSRKTSHELSLQLSGQPFKQLRFSGDFALEDGKNDFGRDINDEEVGEISLGIRMEASLSSQDSVALSGHMARTSYDAPHPDNYNDRDAFRSALKLSYLHFFSEALRFLTEVTVNLNHLVYLRGQRSANNNWGRLYAVYPTLHIRPWKNLLIVQHFSISASYTEYDFDDLFTDIKSNIFRQAKCGTDLSYRLGDVLNFDFSYTYRAEDFGRLVRDDGWAEILSWDKSFQNIDLSISYPLVPRLIIAPNLGYGHRREYEHYQGERNFKSRLISKRIGLSGRYALQPDNDVTFSISRAVERATGAPERTFDRMQLSLQHTF